MFAITLFFITSSELEGGFGLAVGESTREDTSYLFITRKQKRSVDIWNIKKNVLISKIATPHKGKL